MSISHQPVGPTQGQFAAHRQGGKITGSKLCPTGPGLLIDGRQGQWNAGLALGMSRTQVFREIVLPQATMRVLPALASSWVALFKDTSLVSTMELSYVSLQIRAQTFRILEVLTAMAAIYMRLRLYPRVAVARTDSSSAGFFRTSSYLKARLDLWLELMDENR
jgi:hypothetical protein